MNSGKTMECRNCVHWRMFSDRPQVGICQLIIRKSVYNFDGKIDRTYDPIRWHDEFCNNFERQE